jgi:HupE / UreJ protein
VLNPLETRLRFDLERPRPWREFGRFVSEGVWHIAIGYDHVLFLLVLLLPAVLRRTEDRSWQPAEDLRSAFLATLKVVTAFTLAHSATLSLAALDWVRFPSRWVESAIAASIVVAAGSNLWPVARGRTWALALGFGLVHGFGFASVLADLGILRQSLVRALVGFNLGVELGQLAIVAMVLPLAYVIRHRPFYRTCILSWGSGLAGVLAAVWFVQRLRGG